MSRSLFFTAEREVAVREREVGPPGPEEVRVETTVSAVSPGTELLLYRGDAPQSMETDATLPAFADEDLSYPLRYGYAAVGDVTAVGEDVADDWLGETVFGFNPHESAFLAEPSHLIRVPGDCSPEQAAFLPTVETAVNFVMDGRPVVGERLAVFGQGLVGLTTTAILAEFPLSSLVTVETVPERRERSRGFGADESIDPTAVPDTLSPSDGTGVDLAYELSGNPRALDDAVGATAYDGRIVVGSWYGTKRADLGLGGRFHRERIDITSSQVSTIDPEFRGRWDTDRRLSVAWDHLADLPTDDLVTHRLPLGEADSAYETLDTSPEAAVGILFTYDDR
ncbi:zinc-dependent alcohol dehydrogenase [Salinirubrum litoreum]|uniref:Zinc-binding alcohol dehydrogenase n=1 Tax=Salinirubrum litoreum TaxID=1126234 RepID=A0ABD5R818_9EURY